MAKQRNKFTKEQQEILRGNPYVRNVTESQVSFTTEFKSEFWRLYAEESMTPYDILSQLGVDYHMLGSSRVQGIANSLKRERKLYGDFTDERNSKKRETLSPEQEVKRLRMEVDYLRQEQEFIKKIILAGKEEK